MKDLKVIKQGNELDLLSNYSNFFLSNEELEKIKGGIEAMNELCRRGYSSTQTTLGTNITCRCGYEPV